jgi:hypothetical protein
MEKIKIPCPDQELKLNSLPVQPIAVPTGRPSAMPKSTHLLRQCFPEPVLEIAKNTLTI